MNMRKVISVIAVVMVLFIGAVTAFMLLNGDSKVKEKEVPKTSVNPTNSKVGKFGENDSINKKKTTSVGSEEGKKSDDNSDIVSAIDPEKEKSDKPAKVVTTKQDTYTDEVSVSTSNNNSVSVAVDNGTQDNIVEEKNEGKEKTVKETIDPTSKLKQNDVSKKVKSIYEKYGVDVFGSSSGGMYTIDSSIHHSYGTEHGNVFLITINGENKTYEIASEVVDKLGAPGNREELLSKIKEAVKSGKQGEPVYIGKKAFVRSDGKAVGVRW